MMLTVVVSLFHIMYIFIMKLYMYVYVNVHMQVLAHCLMYLIDM